MKSDDIKTKTELIQKKVVAKRLHKTTRTIELWMKDGIIPFIRVQKSILFDWDDVVTALKAYSANQRKGGQS